MTGSGGRDGAEALKQGRRGQGQREEEGGGRRWVMRHLHLLLGLGAEHRVDNGDSARHHRKLKVVLVLEVLEEALQCHCAILGARERSKVQIQARGGEEKSHDLPYGSALPCQHSSNKQIQAIHKAKTEARAKRCSCCQRQHNSEGPWSTVTSSRDQRFQRSPRYSRAGASIGSEKPKKGSARFANPM